MDCKRDLFWGIIKPLKDAIASLGLYLALIATNAISEIQSTTISPEIGTSFNIYEFTIIFGGISFIDEIFSQAIYELRMGYYQPFELSFRLLGILMGMIIFGGVLIGIYGVYGGSFKDALLSWFLSLGCLIGATIFRIYMTK